MNLEILVAFAVLNGDVKVQENDFYFYANPIHQVQSEILGLHISRISSKCFVENILYLSNCWTEIKDAPPLSDLNFLPYELCNGNMEFNRKYALDIYNKLSFYLDSNPNYDYYNNILNETNIIYNIWTNLYYSNANYYSVYTRRLFLKEVREQIGYENYYSGNMPPSVPIWRFSIK